ncbi:MAG: hypothetical protein ABEJ31_00485 [Haloarculaceae archaeon]
MRGQVHTLEAIVAGLLLLTSVVFALQMTAVTPLSASTSSQHIENQQQASAEGVLASAVESGALRGAILTWNASGNRFYDTTNERYYTSDVPPTEFGRLLGEHFGSRGIAFNVYLVYSTHAGKTRRARMIYRGAPSDNAVATSRTVVLTDDAQLSDPSGKRVGQISDGAYLMPDASNTTLYNVVRVEVVAWRI